MALCDRDDGEKNSRENYPHPPPLCSVARENLKETTIKEVSPTLCTFKKIPKNVRKVTKRKTFIL
jgi:hypothetical protein